MKLAAQLIHLLIRMNASTCLIHLYPVSVVRLCLIYKLEKLTDKQFQMKLLPSYPSGNLELKLHMLLEFQMAFTPPLGPHALRISVQETPLPLSSKMLLVLLVWSFSGITQWVITQSSNNHLVQSTSGSQSDSPIAVLYFPRNGQCVEIISCTFFSRSMVSVKFQKFCIQILW